MGENICNHNSFSVQNTSRSLEVECASQLSGTVSDESINIKRLTASMWGSTHGEGSGRSVSTLIEENYIDDDALDTENASVSLIQEKSSSIDGTSTDGSYLEDDDELAHSGDSDSEDYAVSKYMETKITGVCKTRFGVWKVAGTEKEPKTQTTMMDQHDGKPPETWGVAGCSNSLPPLKLTLKKSQQGDSQKEKPLEIKTAKRKYKTKRPSEPKDPNKRGPGRPPSSTSRSSKQKLITLFKKKYFKDRKRKSRTKSTCSLPPTIRSIAKP